MIYDSVADTIDSLGKEETLTVNEAVKGVLFITQMVYTQLTVTHRASHSQQCLLTPHSVPCK